MNDLFPNFLEDKQAYTATELFWKNKIEKIATSYQLSYHWQWLNLNGIQDGNPLVSVYFIEHQKSIRIIQRPYSDDLYDFRVWLNDTEYEDEAIWELVISLVLTEKNSHKAEDFIQKWIVENFSVEQMKTFLVAYLDVFQANQKADF